MPEVPKSQLLRDLCYHEVDTDTRLSIAALRSEYYALASTLVDWLPESRERALALTALEDSLMRAIQCLTVCMPGSKRIIPNLSE